MMTPEQAVVDAILICIVGSALTALVSRFRALAGWLNFVVTGATAWLIFLAAKAVLLAGPSPSAAQLHIPGIELPLRFHVDGLSSIFLILAALIATLAAFFSIAYMRHYRDYGVGRYYPNFLLFLGGMYGVLCTTDLMWVFFLFWQLMTLSSYVLIRFEYRKAENVWAANKYLLMMEAACGLVMLGTKIISGSASGPAKYDFDTVSGNLPALLPTHPALAAFAFGLFLIGFGIKAGMWPFGQMWLPDAHPAAPSPVSALLSGVMIKTGVYGLARSFLWLVPASAMAAFPLGRWGAAIAILGTITLFTGTMQALKQEQSKRLLAFHSIGQVGYILLGLGAGMALLSHSEPITVGLAAIALLGALFHVLNHGLFKGLLFFNAGSMLTATGTQDLNQMGGLMKFMPLTAITALIASFSISGVPLFNGFVSKWTIYVATIQGGAAVRYLPACAVIAILTSALTLASFIKFFGVSFLSRTSELVRSQAAKQRLEVSWMMQIPQVLLAGFCVLLGVVPAIGFSLLQHALHASGEGLAARLADAVPAMNGPWLGTGDPHAAAVFAPMVLAVMLLLMFLLAYAISRLGGAQRRVAAPWLCGYAREAECNRYVAHNFYGEIKRYFRWLGGAPRHVGKSAAVKMKELT
jgi:hydrogenase-4 component B